MELPNELKVYCIIISNTLRAHAYASLYIDLMLHLLLICILLA